MNRFVDGAAVGATLLALTAFACQAQDKPAAGDDGQAKIRFPDRPVPPPPPPPQPGTAEQLAEDQLYVIDSDVELVTIAIPPGLIKIGKPEAGPIKVRAKFVDGTGVETRTFNGKFVYTVEYVKPGLTTLLVFPVGFRNPSEMIQKQIQTVTAPRPPPTPEPPGPEPEPTPEPEGPWSLKWAKPTPLPGGGLRVLVLYDGEKPDTLTAPQRAIVFGSATRKLLDESVVKGPDGTTPERRIYRHDVDLRYEDRKWQDALARKRSSRNWVIISNGNRYIDGPMPATPADFAALLTKVKNAKQ